MKNSPDCVNAIALVMVIPAKPASSVNNVMENSVVTKTASALRKSKWRSNQRLVIQKEYHIYSPFCQTEIIVLNMKDTIP